MSPTDEEIQEILRNLPPLPDSPKLTVSKAVQTTESYPADRQLPDCYWVCSGVAALLGSAVSWCVYRLAMEIDRRLWEQIAEAILGIA